MLGIHDEDLKPLAAGGRDERGDRHGDGAGHDRGHDPAEQRLAEPQSPGGVSHPGTHRDGAGDRIHRRRDARDGPGPERVARRGLTGRHHHGIADVDVRGFARRDVEDEVERSRVGDLDEGLAGIHRGAQHGGHARDDTREGGAQRRELLGAPRGHGRHLRLGEIGGGLVGVLLRQNARLHQARRAGVIALRRVERGGGALRRGVERGPLELDQGVAQGDPLVGSDEDARDPRRARRGELGEMSRARGHGADGSHDPGERLLRRDRGRRRDGLGGGGLRIVGRDPRAAPGREDDEEREASHGWSREAVSSRTAPAASFRSATSSM